MNSCTGKVLFCCGVALYLFTVHRLLSDGNDLNGKDNLVVATTDEVTTKFNDRLLVATRIHMNAASSLPDISKVIRFIKACIGHADGVLVCVGAHDYSARTAAVIEEYISSVTKQMHQEGIDTGKVKFLPIAPWGYFTPALNHAVQFAQDGGFGSIAFQSLEVRVSAEEVKRVLKRLSKPNTIVVGPVMEGHDFHSGALRNSAVTLTGRTCPWNTFAIWRVPELGLVGFPLIGDGVGGDRAIGGVEELSAITMLQRINPKYTAVLLDMRGASSNAGQSWDTNFSDPQRRAYHIKKMESKVTRPAAQLRHLGVEAGTVLHEADL